MSTVNTQNPSTVKNANEAAVSTPKDVDIPSLVEKAASRKISKDSTLESFTLNQTRVFSAVCAEYKSLMGLERSARLPDETAAKITDAIDAFIDQKVKTINSRNAISFRKTLAYSQADAQVYIKLTATGKQILALKDQKLAISILIREEQERLDKAMIKPNPDYDREAKMKLKIRKMEFGKAFIESELKKLEAEQKKPESTN